MLKLEQVARAIAYELGVSPSTNYTDDDLNRMARAAVEALREPGKAAVEFGDAVRGNHADYKGGNGTENVFRAMLDAILSEKPE